MDVRTLFDIYKENSLSFDTRISLLKSLGRAINDHYAMNLTEPIVYELVRALDPDNSLLNDPNYFKYLPQPTNSKVEEQNRELH